MALETFKARLKAKAKTLGAASLSQKRIDAIAARLHAKNPDITEDADHDARIDDFNDLQPLSDIAKEDDRVRTLEAKAKGQPKTEDQEDTEDNDDPPAQPAKGKKKNADEPPAWAKGLIETVSALTKEKVQTSMREKVAAKLKDVPATYYSKRALPEKEEDLDAYVDEVNTDYTAFKQDLINQGLMSASGAPAGSTGSINVSDKAFESSIDSWVKGKEEPATEKK